MRWFTGTFAVAVVLQTVALGLSWSTNAGACKCGEPHTSFTLVLDAVEVTSGDYRPTSAEELFDGDGELRVFDDGRAELEGHERGMIHLEVQP